MRRAKRAVFSRAGRRCMDVRRRTLRGELEYALLVPRPREFDEEMALEKALLAFWRLGYEACSIQDLCEATGLQRQSLYNTFGDKHALFVKTLERYAVHAAASLEALASPEATLLDIRRYIEGVLAMHRRDRTGACMHVKTSFGPSAADAQIREVLGATADDIRAAFARVIRKAMKAGALPKTAKPDVLAAYLYAVLHGTSALAGTGQVRAESAVLDHAFATLGV